MTYLIFALGLLGGVVALGAVISTARGVTSAPASVGWGVFTLTALLASLLSASHLDALLETGSAAEAAANIQAAMGVRSAAKLTLALGFGAVTIVGALAGILRPDPDSSPHLPWMGLLGGLVGALLGGGLVGVTLGFDAFDTVGPALVVLPGVGALLSIAVLLGSLRLSDEPASRARTAAWRGFSGLAAFLTLAMLGELAVELGSMLAFSAVANAALDQKSAILANGLATAAAARPFGWAVGSIPACAAWGTAVPLIRELGPKQRLGMAIASAQALVIVGSLAWASSPAWFD